MCSYFSKIHEGDVVFQARSTSETHNGLAPVQISGYLGFSCSIFFLSIVNDTERKNIVLNVVLLVFSSIMMLLSFSRGGLYFLADNHDIVFFA
jgi:hypothetical protein